MEQADRLCFEVYQRTRVRHRGTACATWKSALDEWPLVPSGRADDRMRTMVRMIRLHTGTSHARALYDQARSVLPAALQR